VKHNQTSTSTNFFYWLSFLQFSNYSSVEGVLYCKPHYDQILKSTGSLDKSFEGTEDNHWTKMSQYLLLIALFSSQFAHLDGTTNTFLVEIIQILCLWLNMKLYYT
jgi:hypothetical protein